MTRKKRIRPLRTIKNEVVDEVINHIPAGTITTVNNSDSTKRTIKMEAYSGAAVDLWDYGFDYPVVYNIATMKAKDKFAFLADHYEAIGHGKAELSNTVVTEGVLLNNNEKATEIWNNLNEEFPYEASLGLRYKYSDVSFYAEGKSVVANGQTFKGPVYVVDNTVIKESSVVNFGRDSNTSVVKMTEEQLMTIKNKSPEGKPAPKEKAPVTPTPVVDNTLPPEKPTAPAPVLQNAPEVGISKQEMLRVVQLLNKYPKHSDIVAKAIENGWSDTDLQDAVELHNFRNGAPNLPNISNNQDNSMLIRMASSLGIKQDFLVKKFGEDKVDNALKSGFMTLREMIVNTANANGGRFNGLGDIENACKYVRELHNTDRFSTIDFPNLMHQVAALRVEQAWTIAQPFATQFLFEDNKTDFKPTKRIRPAGGNMWERLAKDGKIKHGGAGTEKIYTAELDTIAQILTFPRDMVINDDVGYIDQILTLMVDGALMVPDFELVNKIYNGESDGFLTEGANLLKGAGNALSETTLDTAYQLARDMAITKSGPTGDLSVKGRFGSKYILVTSAVNERLAWKLTQPTVVIEPASTGGGNAAGSANYWFGRIRPMTFEQLGNDTYHPDANDSTWMLIPEERLYAPWSISYLNNQRRPITEVVSMPADMLGFGVRGYWDININNREEEAVVVAIPSQAAA